MSNQANCMQTIRLLLISTAVCIIMSLYSMSSYAQETEQNADTADASVDKPRQKPDPVSSLQKKLDQIAKEASIGAATYDGSNKKHWLNTADGERLLALYQAALSAKAYGSVMILHAAGKHPNWPGITQQLRLELHQSNWNALAISLPIYQPTPTSSEDSGLVTNSETGSSISDSPNSPPAATDADSARNTVQGQDPAVVQANGGTVIEPDFPADEPLNPTSNNDNPSAAFIANFGQHIDAGLDFLLEKGGTEPTVLIALGESANWASLALQESVDSSKIAGMIFIEASRPQGIPNDQAMIALQLPILDISSTMGDVRWAAHSRSQSSRRQGRTTPYAWIEIAGLDIENESNTAIAIRRIRGWLRRVFEPTKIPGATHY